MQIKQIAVGVVFGFFAAGCATPQSDVRVRKDPPADAKAQPVAAGATYVSPSGRYTLVLPKMDSDDITKTESGHTNYSKVQFDDSAHGVIAVEVNHVPELSTWNADKINRLEEIDVYQIGIFQNQYRAMSPKAKTLHTERVNTAAGSAYFAVAQIPNVDNVSDTPNVDILIGSFRASLIFVHGPDLYIITTRQPHNKNKPLAKTLDERNQVLLEKLQGVASGMTFTPTAANTR